MKREFLRILQYIESLPCLSCVANFFYFGQFLEVAYNQHLELYFSISRYSTTPHRDVTGCTSGYLAVDFRIYKLKRNSFRTEFHPLKYWHICCCKGFCIMAILPLPCHRQRTTDNGEFYTLYTFLYLSTTTDNGQHLYSLYPLSFSTTTEFYTLLYSLYFSIPSILSTPFEANGQGVGCNTF